MSKELSKKEFKEGCGFRKHLKLCRFKVDQCRPPSDDVNYGDYCNLYPLKWDAKFLKKQGKIMVKDMKELEKELKHLKKTDKEKYRETKKMIRDLFDGCIYIGKAILFIKRSGGGLNKAEKKVANKLMENLKGGTGIKEETKTL